jgi:tetratricopeptide (TPR) repeat protein
LNLEKNYTEIYSRIEQLKSAFENSLVVSQSLSRIEKLEKQCKARIQAAAGKEAFQSNNFSRALQCFKSATELDPALLDEYQKEYGLMLIHGVSNAVAASDYTLALAYAGEYEKLHLSPELLPEEQIDQIRLALAKLSADQGDYATAAELIRGCGDRLTNNYDMNFLAGQVFLNYGEPEEAVAYLQQCMNHPSYADDARELLLESVIRSAVYQQDTLIGYIDDDPELLTLIKTFNITLPGITNVGTTSTWENLCITLCDDVEMTYELLTYSGAEADLFLEKKKARSELDASLKKLQKTLRESLQRRKNIVIASNAMLDWWNICHSNVTNYSSSILTDETREWIKTISSARKYSEYTCQYLQRAIAIDNSNKRGLLEYLENLVYRLENKQPLRNVLGGVKRYLSDERSPDYARTGLSALSKLTELNIQPEKMAEDFSHL